MEEVTECRIVSLTASGHLLHPAALWEELRSHRRVPLGGREEAGDEPPEVCPFCSKVGLSPAAGVCGGPPFPHPTFGLAGSGAGEGTGERQAWAWQQTSSGGR